MILEPIVSFLNKEEACLYLGMSELEIDELISKRAILAMSIATNELCIPVFQFPKRELSEEAIALFDIFPEEWTGWEITCWFYKWNENLHNYPYTLVNEFSTYDSLQLAISVEIDIAEL